MVSAQKSAQKSSRVGLRHAVNEIGLNFVVGRFLKEASGNVDAGRFASARWPADVEAAGERAARGAGDEGADELHLLLAQTHAIRYELRLKCLENSIMMG